MSKTIIDSKNRWYDLNIKEIIQYRELLWTLTYRDIRVKYAHTAIGFVWAFLNPIMSLLIMSFVFGVVARVNTNGIPHILFTLSGLIGWTYFATVMADAGNSIIASQSMVTKVYFPRLIIPLSKAISGLIDLSITLLCLAVLFLWYGFVPSANVIYFPLFLLYAILIGVSAGIWMSALTIRFRDFQYITPIVLRVGMYATPVAFPSNLVPEKFQIIFFLNPVAGAVEGLRWSLLGGTELSPYIFVSVGFVFLLFISGLYYFRKVEKVIADII